ncbi:MAG: putative DNA-binding domain-containing protein [Methylocystis sp.]|uniref:HvfC/BufC family peptide modification chaperone n=1 Tax=Methylocystis sp. TaxID=1911079 RepID=UPI003D1208B0
MKLADFQSLFQARVLAGSGEADKPLLKKLKSSPRGATPETLLGVYQTGYRIRLADFVAEDHPGLRAILGDETFETLVEDYIDQRPSRDPNARWFTTGLPDFMRDSPRWRDDAAAVSMSLLERAMVDAFDSPDKTALSVQALAEFPPEDWPRLAFVFDSSLTLLELSAGTIAAYDAAIADDAPESVERPAPTDQVEYTAVWRVEYESAYRQLEPDEYVALNEARAGQAFGDICQMAAFQQAGEIAPERLAQFLSSWFQDGMIIGVRVQDEDHSSNTPSSA